MKELYLKTENGNVLIEQVQAKKYNLEIGNISPFTRCHIVDKNGKDHLKSTKIKIPPKHDLEDTPDDVIFQTSEMIDISEGVDSQIDANK